ncbi:hypothetical protein B0H17DRAFT_1079818 [Mycena rosella]|uniref:DUF6533 domain-containing protein n=1 Tax=Mycena rosella TaxID=1033263 RepID=A0AAD7D3W0_MYCRO|nr:hypothetical protein B0H17DRAFT_1079818 [Mycena rosella]
MASPSSLISDLQVVSYVKASFLTLLAYDTVLNFDREYRYVWKSRWSVIKFLYLWTRYSAFIDTIIAVQERLDLHRNPSSCNHIMAFTTIFASTGIAVSEIILMIRTHALYERSKKLLVFFIVMWVSISAVNIWAVLQWTQSFKVQAAPSDISACYLGSLSDIGLVCYASLVAAETVLVILTLWKAIQTSTHQRTRLVTSFYRDGVLFYLAILSFSIANVVILFLAPPGLNLIADTPLRVMHSVLCCHLVTHVRAIAAEEETTEMSGPKSYMEFAPARSGDSSV